MSNAEFQRRVDAIRATTRRQSWMLAGSSILLAIPLLIGIEVLESHLSRNAHLIVALLLFLLYLAVMGVILLATRVRVARMRVICPSCGTMLDVLAEHVALETGECNACGGRIIE